METIIYHHGIKGQKWGVRRYQEENGTLTSSGRKRYADAIEKFEKKEDRKSSTSSSKKNSSKKSNQPKKKVSSANSKKAKSNLKKVKKRKVSDITDEKRVKTGYDYLYENMYAYMTSPYAQQAIREGRDWW